MQRVDHVLEVGLLQLGDAWDGQCLDLEPAAVGVGVAIDATQVLVPMVGMGRPRVRRPQAVLVADAPALEEHHAGVNPPRGEGLDPSSQESGIGRIVRLEVIETVRDRVRDRRMVGILVHPAAREAVPPGDEIDEPAVEVEGGVAQVVLVDVPVVRAGQQDHLLAIPQVARIRGMGRQQHSGHGGSASEKEEAEPNRGDPESLHSATRSPAHSAHRRRAGNPGDPHSSSLPVEPAEAAMNSTARCPAGPALQGRGVRRPIRPRLAR